MSLTDGGLTHADELRFINRELAELTHRAPAELLLGADRTSSDPLIFCGVLGGKDVGKSTLVNALAGVQVSRDEAEVGRGTENPLAYVHREAAPAAALRLRASRLDVHVDVALHEADAIRNLVLMDLPDFDSEFTQHLETVRRTVAQLDRILWVVTPRKIGDRDWVAMFKLVVLDPHNVMLVLNKADELLANVESLLGSDEGRDGANHVGREFWLARHDWVAGIAREVGCAHDERQRFLVAAGYPKPAEFTRRVAELWNDSTWERFSAERPAVEAIAALATENLERLRASTLGPLSSERAAQIKVDNQTCQLRTAVVRMEEHFEIARLIRELGDACSEEHQTDLVRQAFGREGLCRCAARVREELPTPTEFADTLLRRQIEDWPILRIVYWAAGWMSRGLGRRAIDVERLPAASGGGRAFTTWVSERVALLRSRFAAEHAAVLDDLGLCDRLPAAEDLGREAEAAIRRLPFEVRSALLEEMAAVQRRPGLFSRTCVLLILLWFPLLQPLIREALRVYNETTPITLGLAGYHLVGLLSASHLLTSLAVVLLIYVTLLTAMFVRRLRRVRSALTDPSGPASTESVEQRVQAALVAAVGGPLAEPVLARLASLESLRTRLRDYGSS